MKKMMMMKKKKNRYPNQRKNKSKNKGNGKNKNLMVKLPLGDSKSNKLIILKSKMDKQINVTKIKNLEDGFHPNSTKK